MSPLGTRSPSTTVMEGVSLANKGRRLLDGDPFDIALSHDGLEIRRPGRARQSERRFTPRKVVVTVTLLAALVTAVTLVLLQSAGIIHLSILGPTA